jgi:hypothetical protein
MAGWCSLSELRQRQFLALSQNPSPMHRMQASGIGHSRHYLPGQPYFPHCLVPRDVVGNDEEERG